MSFPRRLLNDGEDVVMSLHPHWVRLARPTATALAAVAAGVLILLGRLPGLAALAAGVAVLVALGWLVTAYARWATTRLVITTDRLIHRRGVLSKHGTDIPLERVHAVFFSQSLAERVLRSGRLVIASEQGSQTFSDVARPSAVQSQICRQMEAHEARRLERVGAGSARARAPSIPEQIDELAALARRGVLSEQEFQAKKSQLLERM